MLYLEAAEPSGALPVASRWARAGRLEALAPFDRGGRRGVRPDDRRPAWPAEGEEVG
jgi:hypothetical protein